MAQTLGVTNTGASAADDSSSGSSGGVMAWISDNVHWIVAGVVAVSIWKSIAHGAPVVKEGLTQRAASKAAKAAAKAAVGKK